MPLILPGNVASAIGGGYEVANSCRFDGTSAYMSKTPGSDGDAQKFTTSCWFKKGLLAQDIRWLEMGDIILYSGTNTIAMGNRGFSVFDVYTNSNFLMDVGAWYHAVWAVDTTQSTAANRAKIYLNGVLLTSDNVLSGSASYMDQNANLECNQQEVHRVGAASTDAESEFDGYLAEFVHIDGTQYAASDFGEFDEDSPTIWKPKDVSGLTFGTNGFYLDFKASDNLGNDANGGTDLTETNLAAVDQATDTPTNNFCTLNPLVGNLDASLVFSEGNLKVVTSVAGNAPSTFGVSSGKWYWEQKVTSSNGYVAICNDDGYNTAASVSGSGSGSVGYFGSGEIFDEAGSAIGSLTTFTTNDIMGVHLNMDDGTIVWYKNGSIVSGSTYTFGTTGNGTLFGTAYPCWNGGGTAARSAEFNFGGCSVSAISSGNADANGYGNFEYAVPSGVYALCTKNLAEYG